MVQEFEGTASSQIDLQPATGFGQAFPVIAEQLPFAVGRMSRRCWPRPRPASSIPKSPPSGPRPDRNGWPPTNFGITRGAVRRAEIAGGVELTVAQPIAAEGAARDSPRRIPKASNPRSGWRGARSAARCHGAPFSSRRGRSPPRVKVEGFPAPPEIKRTKHLSPSISSRPSNTVRIPPA
ncbi:MAG: hypothetical protein M2R45_03757 [Verrucomicrobia subdivision 3 bacterium]|nr:hypothetical protein [Limisphaerales bacterium]MCS1416919.1 hypothetical protein [Limisphaerales bacterium]